jgi:hypothetical protein
MRIVVPPRRRPGRRRYEALARRGLGGRCRGRLESHLAPTARRPASGQAASRHHRARDRQGVGSGRHWSVPACARARAGRRNHHARRGASADQRLSLLAPRASPRKGLDVRWRRGTPPTDYFSPKVLRARPARSTLAQAAPFNGARFRYVFLHRTTPLGKKSVPGACDIGAGLRAMRDRPRQAPHSASPARLPSMATIVRCCWPRRGGAELAGEPRAGLEVLFRFAPGSTAPRRPRPLPRRHGARRERWRPLGRVRGRPSGPARCRYPSPRPVRSRRPRR